MTDPIDDIRGLLGAIDPALGRPAPRLQSDTLLRAILDDTPPANPQPGPEGFDHAAGADLHVNVVGPRSPRRRIRRRELVSCLAAMAVVVGMVTFRLSSSHGDARTPVVAGRTVVDSGGTGPEAPSGTRSPDTARLLPPAGAFIARLVTYDLPVDSTYQQLYIGTRTTNPPQLVVSTVDTSQHRPGSRLLSGSLPRSRRSVNIGSHRAALRSSEGRTYLWWTQPDGVEVDITAINLTTSEVVHALAHAEVSPTSRLGLDIAGALPADLHPVSSVFTNQPQTPVEELDYRQGACDAQLEVFSNVDGYPVPPPATTRRTTLSGRPALTTTGPGMVTFVWVPVPGFTAEVAASTGEACDVSALAAQVHSVNTAQWAWMFTQLGAKAKHVPATPEFR